MHEIPRCLGITVDARNSNILDLPHVNCELLIATLCGVWGNWNTKIDI